GATVGGTVVDHNRAVHNNPMRARRRRNCSSAVDGPTHWAQRRRPKRAWDRPLHNHVDGAQGRRTHASTDLFFCRALHLDLRATAAHKDKREGQYDWGEHKEKKTLAREWAKSFPRLARLVRMRLGVSDTMDYNVKFGHIIGRTQEMAGAFENQKTGVRILFGVI